MTSARPRLAVDIGGTFTDIAIETPGGIRTAKTLTTPARPVQGVLDGIGHALDGTGLGPADFGTVIHGTTLATNALIERRGARVGVIATEGFRDILEIGYERRHDQYDLYIAKPDMLIPRERVVTVRERMDAAGGVLRALDPASLERAIDTLIAAGVESVAVCLLHSYANPAHEQAVGAALARRAPDLPVSLSAEVSPELREFDRLCTTVCNAYIAPLMATYLGDLDAALGARGFACPLHIVTSGGGITTLGTARRFPVRLVESGPSGGAILAARVAAGRGLGEVLSFDMGGTTAKVCLIENARPRTSRSFEIDRADRYLKGSGIPARIPVIEMIEIGAGGGSIASVDRLGRLRVGPQSASSEPGPACYGRGGTAATVTDADLLAGMIEPARFAEGRLAPDPALAEAAIARAVTASLGLGAAEAADAIARTVDEAMANAARMHAVEQGKALAGCTMVAFGGNGPLHACRVAGKLGIERIVVPPDPGVGSAVGFLAAPVAYEIVRSAYTRARAFAFDTVNSLLAEMEAEATAIVRAGAPGAPLALTRTAFMRYAGQGHEIEVPVMPGAVDRAGLDLLIAGFEAEYVRLFGRIVPGMEIEAVNWSVSVSTTPPAPARTADPATTRAPAPEGRRRLGDGTEAAVFDRAALVPGDAIPGPALIVERQTTTWIAPGYDAAVDGARNIVLTRRAAPAARAARAEIDLQLMWDRLLAIVEEQAQVLIRTAFSPIVRECGDISAGIFDTGGRMLAQAVTGTPGHINTMAMAVGLMLERIPLDTMAPGDIYATNDPWIGAGHVNDVLLVAPIHRNGQAVALAACTSHVYDIGGAGMGPDGRDVHDEGLFIPPLKLVDRGTVSAMLVEIVKANSRAPVANEGDLYALIACCDTARVRLAEMMAEFGLDRLDALAGHIVSRSRAATEAAVAALPPGCYQNEMTLDGYGAPITLRARLTVDGNGIATDFAGSAGHVARGINVPINYTAAYAVFAARCVVAPEIPNNAGSLAPFSITAPRDCILNAQYPAPVASRHSVGHMVSDLVLGCLAQALPGRVPAEGAGCLWDLPLRHDPMAVLAGRATPFATEFSHSGGMGARPGRDGLSAAAWPSGVWGTQVEIAETTCPVRYLRRELIPDSGGPGRFRGGLGQAIELAGSEGAPIFLFATVERTTSAARGRAGGRPGRLGRLALRSGAVLSSKGGQTIPGGDVLVFETPGGGGHGDPLARDPEAVARDVASGLVSEDAARSDYGVVLAEGAADRAATEALRRDIRERASA